MKFLLSPFALLYALIVVLRNTLFDFGVLSSTSFNFPVIAVGNLRVGGTGKTPMVNYLVSMLNVEYKVAMLSRGYGRKTKGFLKAEKNSTVYQIGDEPCLMHSKHPDTIVAVDENRVRGIELLRKSRGDAPELIVLDDAMQHRRVQPGLLIMLTAYNALFLDDYLLPVGRLREPRSCAERADAIIVTKCPFSLTSDEKNRIISRIRVYSKCPVYFSFESYKSIQPLRNNSKSIDLNVLSDYDIVLFSGLADPSHLMKWAEKKARSVVHFAYSDHHWYSESDLEKIKEAFNGIDSESKLILTSQKDAIRISKLLQIEKFADLPFYALEHEMTLFEEDHVLFEKKINDFITSYSANN